MTVIDAMLIINNDIKISTTSSYYLEAQKQNLSVKEDPGRQTKPFNFSRSWLFLQWQQWSNFLQ